MEDKKSLFSPLKQAFRFYDTVRHLKFNQVFYRAYYPLKRGFYTPRSIPPPQLKAALHHPRIQFLELTGIPQPYSPENNTFTFLNRTKSFGALIDWECKEFGLLWSFHLHYFDWLNDSHLPVEKSLDNILQYIYKQSKSYIFTHSFTASYRVVNWIRFCVAQEIRDEKICASLYRQAHRLAAFPEYELMGNHLLENGIALVWAGLFFKEEHFLKAGKEILTQQLPEQVLADGAHFEKSISYHTILLKRLLELTCYCQQVNAEHEFIKTLTFNCERMLSHVFVLTGTNDFLPLFGDSNEGMTLSVQNLKSLAQDLHLNTCELPLGESGIRKLQEKAFTLFFNSGSIPAYYQPGHAHADALTFCLNVNGSPVITDPAVSTYEVGHTRAQERSTAGHNTIVVEDTNSSDVWASFRMGKRAESRWLIDGDKQIECEHKGYFYNYGIIHKRRIDCTEHTIVIEDRLKGWKGQQATIAFHFYPGLEPQIDKKSGTIFIGNIALKIDGAEIYIEDYSYSKYFYATFAAKKLVGIIKEENIRTTIELK